MFFAYVVMIAVTGKWTEFFTHIIATSTNTLFYAIVAFLVAAQIFGATKDNRLHYRNGLYLFSEESGEAQVMWHL